MFDVKGILNALFFANLIVIALLFVIVQKQAVCLNIFLELLIWTYKTSLKLTFS